MSELRKQLQWRKGEYRAARYPGNLADELLAPPQSRGRGWSRLRIGAFVTVATGIAAAIMISLLHTPTITQPPPAPPTAYATTQERDHDDAVVSVAELASLPAFPDGLPLVPSGHSLVPSAEAIDFGAMPEMPSMSFDFGSLSTIEEPV